MLGREDKVKRTVGGKKRIAPLFHAQSANLLIDGQQTIGVLIVETGNLSNLFDGLRIVVVRMIL